MTISPGDYLIADLDGVVVIPKDLVERVIPLMRPQVEADERMAEEIKKGMTFVEANKRFRVNIFAQKDSGKEGK